MAVIHFLIVAVVLFFLVRGINSFRRKQEAEEQAEAESKGPTQEELLVEIRDLLRQNDKLS